MRTAEVARLAGCSVQQVRKLADRGVLPPTPRTTSGYREYGDRHLTSVLAYQALTRAIGPIEARLLMCRAHRDPVAMLAQLDACHADLHRERTELALSRTAVENIGDEPIGEGLATDSMTIGELAGALDLRTSTLRHWEDEGLIAPSRGPHRERIFTPSDVRDVRLLHQLRRAGYRIPSLRELLPTLRDQDRARVQLVEREQSITTRSRALVEATALLREVIAGEPRDAPGRVTMGR